MKQISVENVTYKVGQNAEENWELLENSKKHDIFFHLSSFPSGYVILEYSGELSEKILKFGAKLCKNGTKYRKLKNIKVDYCKCDNLQKGDKIGEVNFISNRKVKHIKI